MSKMCWDQPYIKLALRPLDWWKLSFVYFRHGQSVFSRIGPIDFSFSWYMEERDERGCQAVIANASRTENNDG